MGASPTRRPLQPEATGAGGSTYGSPAAGSRKTRNFARLTGGGRWIRTIGPAVTRELCWRGPPLLPVRERERFSAISSAQLAIPWSRSPMWFGWVAVYRAARRPLRCGGTTRICLRFSSARPAFAERRTKASTRSGEYPAAARSISEVKFVIWFSSCGKVGKH